jgi:hypothetical protein
VGTGTAKEQYGETSAAPDPATYTSHATCTCFSTPVCGSRTTLPTRRGIGKICSNGCSIGCSCSAGEEAKL